MKSYLAILHKGDDSALGVSFPDVPGCFSAADNQADIAKNAMEALALHLDGEAPPPARGAAEIAADPDVDLTDAFLMAIPYEVHGADGARQS